MLKQFVPLLAFLFSQTVYSFHLSSARCDDPIISGNTDFAFALNTQLKKTAGEKNVFFSPLSVSFALTMTMNGSSGETRKAMMEALSYSGISIDTVNSALSKMIESLNKKNKSFEVSIANSLWLLKKYAFKKEFISLCKDKYQAEAREVEFSPNDIDAINDWVKEKTRNKIPKLIDQTEAGSVLMLLNAIYFNGTWAEQFDKDDTRNDTFYVSKEKRVLVPMMSLIERMPYYENKDFQAITLPYKDSNYGMTIFLPTERNSLDKFHQTLKSKNWKEWRSKFKSKKGTLELPRFKYEYEASLIGALKQLGMGIAFD